jgi:5-methylcytosine-specific restriction endonuclease McrA
MIDKKYYRSPEWEVVRRAVFERDGFRCVLCNRPVVDPHHRSYRHFGEGGPAEIADVHSLCKRCHLVFHRHCKVQAGNKWAAQDLIALPDGTYKRR